MMVKRCIAALAAIGGCVLGWRLRQRPRCYRRARAGVLHSVPGLSITGSRPYGDITTAGALQVGLGALQPRPASITAVNEITVEAAAPAVWALLADASRWPHRYAACRWVHSSAPAATCRRHL